MDDRTAMTAAVAVADHYMRRLGADIIDGRTLMKVALAAYLCGSGVPTDEAVNLAEQAASPGAFAPVPPNPMYHGLPWLVPGPASGAPYYQGC